jgi:hypothetical protein
MPKPNANDYFNVSSCDFLRQKAGKIPHAADGLFDILGVKELARRRMCEVTWVSDMFLEVSGLVWRTMPKGEYDSRTADGILKKATITATATGKWAAHDIICACNKALGRETFGIEKTSVQKNPGGLDETKIALIAGADGVRPYLSRRSQHRRGVMADGRMLLQRPPDGQIRRLQNEGYAMVDNDGMERAPQGAPTWSFLMIMNFTHEIDGFHKASYDWRRVARALWDVGLLDIKLGPNGGLLKAECTWTDLARLKKPVVAPVENPRDLHEDDEHGLACLAAGLPFG